MRIKFILKDCIVIILVFLAIPALGQISVHPSAGKTPEQILKEVFVGKGVTISNVKFNGYSGKLNKNNSQQFGTFSNDVKGFPGFFSSGIILCSGNCKVAEGPNDNGGKTELIKFYPKDLECKELNEIVSPYKVNCPAILEFDFLSVSNHVVFRYVFATEEYPNYSCSQFNDVFGFFINDRKKKEVRNIALIPGTNDAVSVNNIHPDFGESCKAVNAEYLTMLPNGSNKMQFNGYVGPFTAEADLKPNQTYHIKLAISNVSDRALESAVFIEALSFNAVDANGMVVKDDGSPLAYSKTDTISETILHGIMYDDLLRNGVVDGFAMKDINYNHPIDLDKYDITAETDYHYLFDSISIRVKEDSISLKFHPYNQLCGCLIPEKLPVNVILTPKANNEEELERVIIPFVIPVVERSVWIVRCFWVLVVLAALLLLMLYLRALLRKNRFHKHARLRNSYFVDDNPKEVQKAGRRMRKPGLSAWIDRWLNPFGDEKNNINFTRPKTSVMTFTASESKNKVLLSGASYSPDKMTIPLYNPRPEDKTKKKKEPISISAGTSIEIKKTQGGESTRLGHVQYVVEGKDDVGGYRLFVGLLMALSIVSFVALAFLLIRGVM